MTEEAATWVNGVPCAEVFRYSLRESDKVFQLDVELRHVYEIAVE